MNVQIKESIRRYHVAFEQNNSKAFTKGPQRGGLQTVTTCMIWLLTEAGGKTLVGRGVTTRGPKDKADNQFAFKLAFTRALDHARLGKAANAEFWQEFHKRHRRPEQLDYRFANAITRFHADYHDPVKMVCRPFTNMGGTFSGLNKMFIPVKPVLSDGCPHQLKAKGSGSDHCAKHAFECTASAPCDRLNPVTPHGYGGLHSFQKQQAEDRCHRVGKTVGSNHVIRIKEIMQQTTLNERRRQWLHGLWAVSDERLTARMHQMELIATDEFSRVEAELLARPGVSKVHNEYIIDPSEFKPMYKVGRVLRHGGQPVVVREVNGVAVTVEPLIGDNRVVMDWELELLYRPSWIVRAGWWVAEVYRRLTVGSHCDNCGDTIFVNGECKYCHQLESK